MAEQPSRKRRIVRSIVLALVGVVLLLGGYLATCWLAWWTAVLPPQITSAIYIPLMLYEQSDLPGSVELETMTLWCAGRGNQPFGEIYDQRSTFRQMKTAFQELLDESRAESSAIEITTQELAEPADPQE